jgi:hypothetical protein
VKYLLMIYGNEDTWDVLSREADVMDRHRVLLEELAASGELVGTEGLTIDGARTVRISGGEAIVTDGPFTESKEMLAGYYLVDCASIERATQIAARIPEARFSPVEVRRIMDDPGEWLRAEPSGPAARWRRSRSPR